MVGQANLSPANSLHQKLVFSIRGRPRFRAACPFLRFRGRSVRLATITTWEGKAVKFLSGIVLAVLLTAGVVTVSAQPEHIRHPRIAKAIEALEDARAYMREAAHDFGGHRVEAMRATDEAIRQLRLAIAYRAEEDREHRR
jgi:hypothetical protein